ncbi:MAG TPA: S41 family peptidase [Kiritimatiellia bacterium]|nr:S41 family peptidase [Kiritimatiellia bacterium]HMP35689.1 S41 family peptidase [Kiritimatiellia bacterium]
MKRSTLTAFALLLATTGLHAQSTTGALDDVRATLASFGVALDEAATSRAARLAAVRTIDPRADWISDEDWAREQADRAGKRWRPDFRLAMTNGLPVIASLPTNGTTAATDLAPGDRITGIATQTFTRIALPEALRQLGTGAATSITLRTVRGERTATVSVARGWIDEPPVETIDLLPNDIGYIKINGLYPGSGRDVVSRIRAWSEGQRVGMILDLRGAGGDDLAAVTQIASLFARGGQFLFAFRDHHQQDVASYRATEGYPVSQPVMVLVDGDTRGASEVLAAVINGANRRALLIGTATRGDFLLREPVAFGNERMFFATKVLDTADGLRYTGQAGVEPAIPLTPAELDTRDYEPPPDLLDRRGQLDVELRDAAVRRRVRGDGALERAVDMIVGLKSLNNDGGTVSSSP